MTVSTTTNTVVYRGNGAATDFAVPFKVLDEDHLVVSRRVFETAIVDRIYLGTDYSYAGIGDPAGTLTLSGDALADDYELVIERVVPYRQDLDIVNAGGFYPETVEQQLDLIEMQIQQLSDKVNRSVRGQVGLDQDDIPFEEGDYLVVGPDGQVIGTPTPIDSGGISGTGVFINIAAYGASPSATAATNTAAIQAAEDAAQPGNTIIAPPGTFLFNGNIQVKGGVKHFFSLGTVFKLADGVACRGGFVSKHYFTADQATFQTEQTLYKFRPEFYGLHVDCNAAGGATGSGLVLLTSEAIVTKCRFINYTEYGLELTCFNQNGETSNSGSNFLQNKFIDNRFTSAFGKGAFRSSGTGSRTTDGWFCDNSCTGGSDYAIFVQEGQGWNIETNQTSASYGGIFVEKTNHTTIKGNIINAFGNKNKVGTRYGIFAGGMTVTQAQEVVEGNTIEANYNATAGANKRLEFDSGGGHEMAVGEVVTGATSGATGTIATITVESGSWFGGDAAGYMELRDVTGSFIWSTTTSESLDIPGFPNDATTASSLATSVWVLVGFYGATFLSTDKALAITGNVGRFVNFTRSKLLNFDSGGTHQVVRGESVVGQTSGAGGTVLAVILTSGSWAGGDAAGTIVLGSVKGTFQNNELLNGWSSDEETEYADVGTVDGVLTYVASQLLRFDSGGTHAIEAGEVVEGVTSGAIGVVIQISQDTGTWAAGDAKGTMRLHVISGVFQDNEALDVTDVDSPYTVYLDGATVDGVLIVPGDESRFIRQSNNEGNDITGTITGNVVVSDQGENGDMIDTCIEVQESNTQEITLNKNGPYQAVVFGRFHDRVSWHGRKKEVPSGLTVLSKLFYTVQMHGEIEVRVSVGSNDVQGYVQRATRALFGVRAYSSAVAPGISPAVVVGSPEAGSVVAGTRDLTLPVVTVTSPALGELEINVDSTSSGSGDDGMYIADFDVKWRGRGLSRYTT